MGIGINKSDSALSSAVNTGAKAGLIAGAIEAGKIMKPMAMDSYQTALTKQLGLIDKFQKSGKTVAEYMERGERAIKGAASPGVSISTYKNWLKKIKAGGLTESELTDKIAKMTESAVEINKLGTDKALKKLQESKKLFETGNVSKFDAAKDAAGEVLTKVKDNALGLKDNLVSTFKKTEGDTLDKLKAVKNNVSEFLTNNPAIKKAGKTALIVGAAVGALAFISKAASNHKNKD